MITIEIPQRTRVFKADCCMKEQVQGSAKRHMEVNVQGSAKRHLKGHEQGSAKRGKWRAMCRVLQRGMWRGICRVSAKRRMEGSRGSVCMVMHRELCAQGCAEGMQGQVHKEMWRGKAYRVIDLVGDNREFEV